MFAHFSATTHNYCPNSKSLGMKREETKPFKHAYLFNTAVLVPLPRRRWDCDGIQDQHFQVCTRITHHKSSLMLLTPVGGALGASRKPTFLQSVALLSLIAPRFSWTQQLFLDAHHFPHFRSMPAKVRRTDTLSSLSCFHSGPSPPLSPDCKALRDKLGLYHWRE